MPEPSPSSLDALLEQCILANESGASVDEILAAHPDAAPALRERLDHLASLGILQAPKSSAAIPEHLGEFRLLRQIGRGGMGIVYLAEQTALQRHVALKLVHPEQLFFGGARERFRREVLAVARLQHPGIVPILTCGEAEGIPFYAMDLVHGASVGEVLAELAGTAPDALTGPALRAALQRAMAKKKELEGVQDAPVFQGAWTNVCCRLVREAAVALQHAHDQGVLHRDLKPSNLLLTSTGQVRLIDFGLASARGEQRLTRSGATLGSLPYMAPEQVRGDVANVDVRTDVYALGVTLYELLTLALPHGDGSGNTRERILAGHVEPPSRSNGFVHADAEAVCLKAMDLDPARRYRTAAEFANDLQAFLEHRTVAARRPSLLLRSRRWARRNPMRAATAIVAFVVLVPGPLAIAIQQNVAATNLQKALLDVEAQRKIAQRNLEEVQAEQRRAEANFDYALRAVDLMLLRTSEARLVHQPRTAALRRQLLQDAVAFHETLLASGGGRVDDQRPREELARSLSRLGSLQSELGDSDKALELLTKAIAQLEALGATTKNPDGLGAELAGAFERLAAVYMRTNRVDEGERATRRCMEILDGLLARSANPRVLEDSLDVRLRLAMVLQRQGRGDEAVALLDSLDARLGAPDADLQTLSAATLVRLAAEIADARCVVLARSGDTGAAKAAADEALRRIDTLPEEVREAPNMVTLRASILQRIGLVTHQRRDWEAAQPYLDRACADLEKLMGDEPGMVRWPINFAGTLSIRAANAVELGRIENAGADHDRAVAILEKARTMAPREGKLPGDLAMAIGKRASFHQLRNDHRAAMRDFARAAELLEEVVTDRGADDLDRSNLATTLANHAQTCLMVGDLAQARALVGRAITILRECKSGERTRSLVEVLGLGADLAMRAGDRTEALAMMDEARVLAAELLAQSPDDVTRQFTVGFIALNQGTLLVNAGELDRAIETWQPVVPMMRKAAQSSKLPRETLALLLLRLADICDRLGRKTEALAWFEEAVVSTGIDTSRLDPYPSLLDLFDRSEFLERLPVGHPDR